ncbi:MAG: hypothetical protein KAS71_05845 [Bacteroidales bacterium]|nr:hypothetical protein [Bacteroidales bacterium]
MKLESVLSNLNSFEKNSFLKIIDTIISNNPKNAKEIDKILSDASKELKNIDSINISRIFTLIEDEYQDYIKSEFVNLDSQLDIVTDILTRDGRCIARHDWFARLYESEINALGKRLKKFNKDLQAESSEIDTLRKRDYLIYRNCVHIALCNDDQNNQERKITKDEQSILIELAKSLELSQEETKLINYSVLSIEKRNIEEVINELRLIGVIFDSKKNKTIYVPQEIVSVLRNIRGKEIANKFYRRVLRQIREPIINIACRKHNIDWKLPVEVKIEFIISEGISFSNLLINDLFKEGANVTEKKRYFNELTEKGLKISPSIKGVTIEDKVENLIFYFNDLEREEKVSISFDGYEKLILDLKESLPHVNKKLKSVFELQEENVMNSNYLLDYNLKPQDILDIIPEDDLKKFIDEKGIKSRGDSISKILENYKDSENLYLENYENIAFRNYSALKENGIQIPEAQLGIKFEDLTKTIFIKLGFNVDEELRKKLNTAKDKIDIVLNIGKNEIIVVECKSVKDKGFNKFSSVYRQLKAYWDLATKKEYRVIKSILIAPDFTDDFINECELEYELNLSLITAESLSAIYNGFKNSKMKELPYKLLMRDVLIQSERILKVIK